MIAGDRSDCGDVVCPFLRSRAAAGIGACPGDVLVVVEVAAALVGNVEDDDVSRT